MVLFPETGAQVSGRERGLARPACMAKLPKTILDNMMDLGFDDGPIG
jgi:hypothetical protein